MRRAQLGFQGLIDNGSNFEAWVKDGQVEAGNDPVTPDGTQRDLAFVREGDQQTVVRIDMRIQIDNPSNPGENIYPMKSTWCHRSGARWAFSPPAGPFNNMYIAATGYNAWFGLPNDLQSTYGDGSSIEPGTANEVAMLRGIWNTILNIQTESV